MDKTVKYEKKIKNQKSDREKTKEKLKKLVGLSSCASVYGREKLEISCCRGIMIYKEDIICVRLCDGVIKIIGTSLRLCNFYGGRMIIRGKIDSIEFSDR